MEEMDICMDVIPIEVLNAMQLLMATKEREDINNTEMVADYLNGKLIYRNNKAGWEYSANVNGDSVSGVIKDFAKQMMLGESWN